IYVYPGPVAQFQFTMPTYPPAAGYSFTLSIAAQDAYHNAITNYNGTVHFTGSDTGAILPADYTFVPSDYGWHSFPVTLVTAGDQTVTATDQANAAVTGTGSVTVYNYVPGLHFGITPSVSSTVAGTPFSVTVTAYDRYNAVAWRYIGTATFWTSDRGSGGFNPTIPADYTFTPADAGVHVFTNGVRLVSAGYQRVDVHDSWDMTGSTAGDTVVQILPGPAASFTVNGFPATVTAGTGKSFTVTAKDVFTNVATGYSGTVHFTSSDAQAALPADARLTN